MPWCVCVRLRTGLQRNYEENEVEYECIMAAAAGGDVNGDKWWDCRNCIRKAACPIHVPDMVGHAGPNSIQKQLNAAESKLLKAQLMVDALRKSLQRTKTQGGVASGSPTLAVLHPGGGNDDGEGWEPGPLWVSRAGTARRSPRELGAALREAMQDVSELGGLCPLSLQLLLRGGAAHPRRGPRTLPEP
ncbi:uncharacterized protein LOC117645862 isoform X3 [Thrips palmi]|uniref:Uncharacterized protein LOC117645862 isoform X3 n=1 Tax=Thrips palmi TaxID=161013 RepID=A0A6P8YQL4_THRPL|nr:uncharacterized protein LOC117645862 isoform X3 [Thrips palmi]